MINETDDVDSIVKCIMEDGFESGLAESFYDKDRFMSYLDEKYDHDYEKITNNGENNEKWHEYLNEKANTEDNRSDEFFDRYKNEYEDFLYDALLGDDEDDYEEEF